MEKSLKGTMTEKNLLKAFAGESQAKNRYEFAAKVAKSEGYEQIAAIFLETALQEQQHAKRFFNFLEGGMVEITASYPAGKTGTTSENLEAAAAGEHEEWNELYPEAAEVAREEGYDKIAESFTEIAEVEEQHYKRYKALAEVVKDGNYFKRDHKVYWKCRNCGYIHEGEEAPKVCPACKHAQKYFEVTSFEQ